MDTHINMHFIDHFLVSQDAMQDDSQAHKVESSLQDVVALRATERSAKHRYVEYIYVCIYTHTCMMSLLFVQLREVPNIGMSSVFMYAYTHIYVHTYMHTHTLTYTRILGRSEGIKRVLKHNVSSNMCRHTRTLSLTNTHTHTHPWQIRGNQAHAQAQC